MEEPTGSPSDEPNKHSRRRRQSTIEPLNFALMAEPTGGPSDESNTPSRGRRNSDPGDRPNKSNTPSRGRRNSDPGDRPNTGSSKHAESKENEKTSFMTASLPPMNLMMFGRKGIQKTSIGNIILSQSDPEQNISSDFSKRQAGVCGYTVTLVEVPSLATTPLSLKEVLEKCHHSISQCAPGINAFLLALPGGHFTDEDKEELQMIQSIFGPRVKDYIIKLYTNVPCPKDKPVQYSLGENTHLEQQFHKGCFVLSQEGGHEQISEMLKKIKGKSHKCFTTGMFVEAQIEERCRLQTIEDMKQLKISPVIQNPDSTPDCVRIVLIGKTGVGKSATGNTILGNDFFKSAISSKSVTTLCKKDTAQVNGRSVAVVDTPGLFDTSVSNENVLKEILTCFSLLAPGPHVFLLLLSINTRMTAEENETLKLIKDTFGARAEKFTIILFTKGDNLGDQSIEQYIKDGDSSVQQLISDCEGRYHVFKNNDEENHKQVTELMEKIDRMVEKNGGGCYTNEMFQMAEVAIKEKYENLMKKREFEIKKELQDKFDEEIETMMDKKTREIQLEREERERLLREKEEYIIKERQRRDERERKEREKREAEDKMRREKDETQRQSWARTLEEVQKKHKEQLKEEKEKAAKDHKEWLEMQRKEKSEFKSGQKEERRKREEEERSRKEKEKLERQKLEARVKDAEKLTEEIRKERKKELREWEDKRMKEKLNGRKEREVWEKSQKKMKEDFETEKEGERKERDSKEEARREQERKERERMENQHAKKIEEMKHASKTLKREWTKAKEEETERRLEKDKESKIKIRGLQEEFEREKTEEKKRRKKEDEDREEEHKKMLNKIGEKNQKKIEMLTKKYEDEARKKAELNNAFSQQELECFVSKADKSEIDQLKTIIKEWEKKHKKWCRMM